MRKVLVALTVALLAAPAEAKPKKAGKGGEPDIGLGGGIFIAYPPMITVDADYRLSKWLVAGVDAGYLTVPVEEFQGTSTYFGLDAKYFFGGASWFAGLSLGRRTFEITTYNRLTVGETSTEVAWTRHVSQQVFYPKVGWMNWSKGGHSLVVAAGIVVPFGSSFSIEHDPEKIEGGLTQEDLDTEEEARADDVKQVTHKAWPSVELKYARFFDWVK